MKNISSDELKPRNRWLCFAKRSRMFKKRDAVACITLLPNIVHPVLGD